MAYKTVVVFCPSRRKYLVLAIIERDPDISFQVAVFPALLHTSYPLNPSDLVPLTVSFLPGLRVSADNRDIFCLDSWILSQPCSGTNARLSSQRRPDPRGRIVLNSWHDTVATKSGALGSQTFCRLPVCDSNSLPLTSELAMLETQGIYGMKLRYTVRIYRNYFRLGICRH